MRTKIATILALVLFATVSAQEKTWSLLECIDYAVENNISIKQQALNNELIEEDIVTAKGNFYPSLNASASQSYNFGSFIGNDGARISRDSRSNSFGLNSGVTLYNGKRNVYTLLQAQKNLEAAGFDLTKSKNDIMLFVVNSYLTVLLNKESLKIAQDQEAISIRQVEKAQGLFDAGSQPRSQLLEAQATLATNQQQVTAAQNTVDLALLSLAQLLQISHVGFDVQDVNLTVDAASLLYNDTDDIYAKAVTILPEIKSAEIAVENSEIGVKMAEARKLPSLTLGGGLGTSYQHSQGQKDVRPMIDPDDPNNIIFVDNGFGEQIENNLGYNFGFNLSIPIFNGFQTKAGIQRAKINKERAELTLLDQQVKLRESIERAYADAKASLDQYVAAEKSLVAQEESFRNAQESYNSGVMTSFDFDQVRNRLVNAQSSMVNAKYNFVFRTKLLEYYYGIPIVLE